jgi:hypothetical protein
MPKDAGLLFPLAFGSQGREEAVCQFLGKERLLVKDHSTVFELNPLHDVSLTLKRAFRIASRFHSPVGPLLSMVQSCLA